MKQMSSQIIRIVMISVLIFVTTSCQAETDFYKSFDRGRYPEAVIIMNETENSDVLAEYEAYVVKKIEYYFEEIQKVDESFTKSEENDLVALAQSLAGYDLDVTEYGASEFSYLALKAYATTIILN